MRSSTTIGLFFLLFASPVWLNAQATDVYYISGKVMSNMEGSEIALSKFDPVSQERNAVAAAVISSQGFYELKFQFTEPDLYRVDFPGKQSVMLAIDKGQKNVVVNVEGKSGGSVEIKGSPDSEKLFGYEAFRMESNERLVSPTYDAMKVAGDAGDKLAEIEAVSAYAHASEQHRKELLDYTAKHIGASVALYGTMLRWTGDDEVSRLEKLVNDFRQKHPGLKMTQVMLDKVARFKKVAIGVKAPDILEKDLAGKLTSLYDIKGKITLLDFWASWCGPCLRQIPELKEAYAAYHNKGFEIVGISVDSRGDRWKATIEKYGMDWPHLSDLKGWGSKAAADYNVTFIPFNLLMAEDGTILAKNLHSKELQGMLEQLLEE